KVEASGPPKATLSTLPFTLYSCEGPRLCAASCNSELISDSLPPVVALAFVALQNSEDICLASCAWLSASVYRLVLATVRPPASATGPQLGTDWPIVAPW